MAKIVKDEIGDSTNPIDDSGSGPTVHHVLIKFENLSKRYTTPLAYQTLAMATGKKKYLTIKNPEADSSLRQRLAITSEGLILLTPSGYLKALAESINAALLISILALIVSVLVAVFKG